MTADALAAALLDARRTRRPVPAADAERMADGLGRDGALAVQARVAESLGPVGGWKCAPAMGSAPATMGPIFASLVRPSGTGFGKDELFACGIELELAFRIDRLPPAASDPSFRTALREAVTPLVVIEIVDGRAEAFADRSALVKLADVQLNGGLVVGDSAAEWPDTRLLAVALAFDGETVLDGTEAPPGGDAFETLAGFVVALGDHCGGLQPGQIVTTGALGGVRYVAPGTRVAGTILGVGRVETTFG